MQRSLTDTAQQVICNQQVIGSNPIASSLKIRNLQRFRKEIENCLCTAYAFIRFQSRLSKGRLLTGFDDSQEPNNKIDTSFHRSRSR